MKHSIEDEYSVPMRCNVCSHCRYNPHLGVCINGGPYVGYAKKDQKEAGSKEPPSSRPKDT